MKKGYIGTMLMASTLLILGACSKEEEPTGVRQEVVVNNGDLANPSEVSEETSIDSLEQDTELATDGQGEQDVEESIVVPEREVYSDNVPKTGRDKIIQDAIRSEIPYGNNSSTNEDLDLSVEYVEVNGGLPETADFNIPYTLYYAGNDRSVGGEGVVVYSQLGQLPEGVNESDTKLYELELLHTGLFNDERGLEDRNKVMVTKQAYNLITELNQSVYNTLDPDVVDNKVYISLEALYLNDSDEYPYGIHYQAQSVHGDISFNYIIHNSQKGYTVDYTSGVIKAGDTGE